MRKVVIALAGLCLLAACGPKHFITNKDFRATVEEDFRNRAVRVDLAVAANPEEEEALKFLYAYMPLADVTDYTPAFFLENVRAAFATRSLWNVPEREFRHFVLPLRVNNESLDSARVVFARELLPRITGLSMQDAILEVNHWCHEKVTYQPSDARTSSPLNLVKNALGRCGEQSTFCVTALRSVGIPARQVYTPRWAHTDDNHAWVEAWADGQWWFLGACEPEPVLNLGWFNAPASRAMLMHTKVFGKYDGPEEVVLESPNFTEVNLIDNYAKTARIDFTVLNNDGAPVEGARVDFCIYNYAEFYPAVTKYTDAQGHTFSSAGLGDMLIWASKDGAYGYARASFGQEKEVTITLDSPFGSEAFTLVPPPENVQLPEVTPEQRAANDKRFAREDELRHAYEATFLTQEQALSFVREQGYPDEMASFLVRSRGNWATLEAFLKESADHETVRSILASLSGKDLHDVTPELLRDAYRPGMPYTGFRVENEFLSAYNRFFGESFVDGEACQSPERIRQWVVENITVQDDPKAWRIPMSPAGVYTSRLADPRSRDIFFVDLCRFAGFDAQKDPVTGKVQYKKDGQWLDVSFDGDAEAAAAPQGILKLSYTPTPTIANPQYYTHFSLSKIENGRPRLMAFDEGEVDMGGGVDWARVFKKGYPVDAGDYLLVSGNRLSNGSVPVSMLFFSVAEGGVTEVPLRIDEGTGAVPVIGSLDAESLFTPDGSAVPQSVLSAVGRGFYVLGILDPGKEPTNHALRDLIAARERLAAWGRPIVLLCESAEALEQLKKEAMEGRYGPIPRDVTVVLGVDTDGIRAAIAKDQKRAGNGRLPLVVIADTFNRLFFCSEGYTIGLGDQIATVVTRL
jgi:transglutaminase-like putative cysteine protease